MNVQRTNKLDTLNRKYVLEVEISKSERLSGKLPHYGAQNSTFIEISEDGLLVGFFDEENDCWRDANGDVIAEEE